MTQPAGCTAGIGQVCGVSGVGELFTADVSVIGRWTDDTRFGATACSPQSPIAMHTTEPTIKHTYVRHVDFVFMFVTFRQSHSFATPAR